MLNESNKVISKSDIHSYEELASYMFQLGTDTFRISIYLPLLL
jgi:hypothetical protein